MRIAHIIWALGTGGAESMLVDIANRQVETETVAIAVVNDLVDDALLRKIDNHCIVRLFHRSKGSKSFIPWIKLNLFLFKFKPDIIHFHLEGMRKMVFYPAPKVFTIHNAWTSGREYPKYQALYAISDGVRNYTRQQGFDAITVWNGINTRNIKVKSIKPLNFGANCNIVCVGRLFINHKGQDILLKALHILKQKGIKNFHLDIIGDGESKKQLIDMISEYELFDNVSLLGQKDRDYIYTHLCDYDLFVLPSRSEGFGLSVAEAMCAKVPVLVCNLEGPMGVINNGILGISFLSEDFEDLSNKLYSFISNGANSQVVDEAFQYAKDHFDIGKTASRYIEEYKKVLNCYK